MKRMLLLLCLAFTILFQSYSFCTEGTIYNPPVPNPKLSIEKALEIFRSELKKDYTDENAKPLKDYIVFSIEYRSYNYIKKHTVLILRLWRNSAKKVTGNGSSCSVILK